MTARRKRTVMLLVRLRPGEAREIRAAAGDDPAATWVRAVALKAAGRKLARNVGSHPKERDR